jgi:hypothetical protein
VFTNTITSKEADAKGCKAKEAQQPTTIPAPPRRAAPAAAAWWRPAALGVIPYAVWRRPKVTQGHFVRGCFETIAIDAARTAGHLYGAMRSHILVV